jgi:hypothetical protein
VIIFFFKPLENFISHSFCVSTRVMQRLSWFKALENKVLFCIARSIWSSKHFFQTLWEHLGEKHCLSRNVVAVTDLWRHQKEMKGDQRLNKAAIWSISNPKNKVLLNYSSHNFRKLVPGVFPWSLLFLYNYLEADFSRKWYAQKWE